MTRRLFYAFSAALIAASSLLQADWLTFGGDAQRSGWAKNEDAFTKENAKNIGLQWKVKLDNQAKELNALMPPIVMEGVVTPHGFKEYVFVAGASDVLFVLDADNGKLVWKKQFETDKSKLPKSLFWLCPNAVNATPVIHKYGDKNLPMMTVFALASDGKLHGLNVNNGEDRFPPIQFTPPYSKNWSLNYHDGVIYTTTSQNCADATSGVWAMDFKTPEHKVTFAPSTNARGAGVWGRGGVAIGKTRAFAESGDSNEYDPSKGNLPDSVIAVSLADQKVVDYYTPANRAYVTRKDLDMGNMSPIVFPYKDKEIVAAAGKEGVIYLLDGASLGGADHRTPLFRKQFANADVDFAGRGFWGAFATWQDPNGDRWLFAPASGPVTPDAAPLFGTKNGDAPNGSIMAFKVQDKDGKAALTPVWISRDFDSPEPPVVANGVVFAVSNGEFARQAKESGGLYSSKERADLRRGNAVLYALDATTGKELFSSGKTMESFTHFSGISVASGHVFVVTFDNNLYAFGLKE